MMGLTPMNSLAYTIFRSLLLCLITVLIPQQLCGGFITIENFSTPSSFVSIIGLSTGSNTTASSGAIGGYRTLSLTAIGDNEFTSTVLGVSSVSKRISLSTPDGNTATSFSVKWAGQYGTGFATPVNLLTLPQGMNSELEFSLRSSDQAGTLTWSVTDVSNKVSSYVLSIPVQPSTNPAVFYELRLNNFSNPTGFDWTQVKSIEVSGGGISEWDFSTTGPIVIGVPEPNLAFLLCAGLSFTVPLVRRRSRA